MKISLCLQWVKAKAVASKNFKSLQTYQLLRDYGKRIEKVNHFHIRGKLEPNEATAPGSTVWLCDFKKNASTLSSESLADKLQHLMNTGVKHLFICIGAADGFNQADYDALKPSLQWAFGPLTLPHELAATVAGEQIYRGFAILQNLPYHKGH